VAGALEALDTIPAPLAGKWRGTLSADFRHLDVELDVTSPGVGRSSLSIRELGVDADEVRVDELADGRLRGTARLRAGTLEIAARAGGDRLVGWMQYRGTRYPMVLERPRVD